MITGNLLQPCAGYQFSYLTPEPFKLTSYIFVRLIADEFDIYELVVLCEEIVFQHMPCNVGRQDVRGSIKYIILGHGSY